MLSELHITIELGNPFNKNANAVVDKVIQELEQEIIRIIPQEEPITHCQLVKATYNLNSRLRRNQKLTAKEIFFCRDVNTNRNIHLLDDNLADEQLTARNSANHKHNLKTTLKEPTLENGDAVMLCKNPTKHTARDIFLVKDSTSNDKVQVQKVANYFDPYKQSKVRNKIYHVDKSYLFKTNLQKHRAEIRVDKNPGTYDPVAIVDSSDSEDEIDEIQNDHHQQDPHIEDNNDHLNEQQQNNPLNINHQENNDDATEQNSPENSIDHEDQNNSEESSGNSSIGQNLSPEQPKEPERRKTRQETNAQQYHSAIRIQRWYRKKLVNKNPTRRTKAVANNKLKKTVHQFRKRTPS